MHTLSDEDMAKFMQVCDLLLLIQSGSARTSQRIEREEKNLIVANHANVALFYGVSRAGIVSSAPAAPGLVTLYYQNQNVMKYLKDNPDKASLNDRLRLVSGRRQ